MVTKGLPSRLQSVRTMFVHLEYLRAVAVHLCVATGRQAGNAGTNDKYRLSHITPPR